jgi:hypothetical protein
VADLTIINDLRRFYWRDFSVAISERIKGNDGGMTYK